MNRSIHLGSSSGCFHPGGTYQCSLWMWNAFILRLCVSWCPKRIFAYETNCTKLYKIYIYLWNNLNHPIHKPFGSPIPCSLTSRIVDGGTFNSCAALVNNGVSWIHKVHQIHSSEADNHVTTTACSMSTFPVYLIYRFCQQGPSNEVRVTRLNVAIWIR